MKYGRLFLLASALSAACGGLGTLGVLDDEDAGADAGREATTEDTGAIVDAGGDGNLD